LPLARAPCNEAGTVSGTFPSPCTILTDHINSSVAHALSIGTLK